MIMLQQYCKLSDDAKKYGVTYRTAFNRFNAGKLPGAVKDAAGHICVPIEYLYGPISTDVTIYATAISKKDEDSDLMDRQVNDMKRLLLTISMYCSSLSSVRLLRLQKQPKTAKNSSATT